MILCVKDEDTLEPVLNGSGHLVLIEVSSILHVPDKYSLLVYITESVISWRGLLLGGGPSSEVDDAGGGAVVSECLCCEHSVHLLQERNLLAL